MAFLLNPQFGRAPGAPHGLNFWDGNRFMMSDLLGPQAPAAPQAPPAPAPLAPQVNAQDTAAQQAVQQFASGGGSGGGGSTGGNSSYNSYAGTGGGYTPEQRADMGRGIDPASWGQIAGVLGAAIPYGGGTALTGLANAASLGPLNSELRGAGAQPLGLRDALGSTVNGLGFGLGGLLTGARSMSDRVRDSLLDANTFNNPLPQASANRFPFQPNEQAYLQSQGVLPESAARANAQVDATLGSIATTGYTNDPSYTAGSRGLDPSIGLQSAYDQAGAQQAAAAAIQGGYDTGAGGGAGTAPGGPAAGGYASLDAAFADGLGRDWARGGKVRGPGLLPGIDPPGPDNIVGGLQTGEGVITKTAMKRYGPGLLNAINSGKIDPRLMRGLLSK